MKRFIILLALIGLQLSTIAQKVPKEVTEWSFKTRKSIFASPTIHKAIVYIGSLDSTLYAIDSKNGKKIWEFSANNEIRSSAFVTKNSVLFESGNVLYSLDLKGKLLWKKELFTDSVKNQVDPWDFYHSSPIVEKGVAYIGTENGLILGFKVSDGNEVFRYQLPSKSMIRTTPNFSKGILYFADWDGVMYAYHIKKKQLLWDYDTRKDTTYMWVNAVQAQPTISKNLIFFGGRNSRLYALDKTTGEKKWMYASPTNQWILGSPEVSNGMVYIGSSDQHLILAFDTKTGKQLWQTKIDSRTWDTINSYKGKLYFGSRAFYKLDSKSGKIERTVNFKPIHKDIHYGKYVDRRANFHSSSTIVDGKIIIGSDDGTIYAFNLAKL